MEDKISAFALLTVASFFAVRGYKARALCRKALTKSVNAFVCDKCLNVIRGQFRYVCWTCDDEVSSYDLCGLCKDSHEHELVQTSATSEVLTIFDNAAEKVLSILEQFAVRKCIGVRRLLDDGTYGAYEWTSYQQLGDQAKSVALFLQDVLPANAFVSISMTKNELWYIAEFGIIIGGFVCSPIHHVFDINAIQTILQQTKCKVVFITSDLAAKYVQAIESLPNGSRKITLVVVDSVKVDIKSASVKFCYLSEIVKKYNSFENYVFPSHVGANNMVLLTYTSGSTGIPKGSIMVDSQYQTLLSGISHDLTVEISFGPIAHGTAHNTSTRTLSSGGRMGVVSRGIASLFEDIKELRPTFLVFPPRIYSQLCSDSQAALSLELESHPEYMHGVIKERHSSLIRENFGGRVRSITTGGAATDQNVIEFLEKTFKLSVYNAYGATEVQGIAINGKISHGVQVKLTDVPELNYFSSDSPLPRGELWVKADSNSPGYFDDAENNSNSYDSDGYFCTGDIVEYDKSKNSLKIIDRKKNFFKLSQSEFVAPEKLENVFLESPYVDNCYIYGESTKSYVIAIVIPNELALIRYCATNNIVIPENSNARSFCANDQRLKELIILDLARIGAEHKFRSFELPRAVYLEPVPWTCENRLLTPSFKISRLVMRNHYKEVVRQVYEETEKRLNAESVSEILKGVLQQDLAGNASLVSAGIDSISAVKIQYLVQSKLGYKIPIAVLLNSETCVDNILNLDHKISSDFTKKEEQIKSDLLLPAEIIALLQNNDWNVKKLPDVVENSDDSKLALALSSNSPRRPCVFLTGANGFVGAFLLNELIQSDYIVVCLVRSGSSTAEKRLETALIEYELNVLLPLFNTRIFVIDGELGLPWLGLPNETFELLSRNVDFVMHNGALVNSILSYDDHRGANVLGTLDIIRLACTWKLKPVYFASTLSVFSLQNLPKKEENYIEPKNLLNMGGYASTKLVGEELVKKAGDLGLPFRVFRLGTISGHSLSGACNRAQFVNRFIAGIVQMKSSPDVSTVFDMVPVDFVCKAICQLSFAYDGPRQYFHLFNTKTAMTVGQISDAIRDLGFPLKTLNFHDWRDELNGLNSNHSDEKAKANALLPLLSYFDVAFPTLGFFEDSETLSMLTHCAFTFSHIQDVLAKFGLRYPPIDKKIIEAYLNYLV